MIEAKDILGTWLLRSYVFRFRDGSVKPRHAAGSEGRLHYLADGWMSAHLMARDRAPTGDDMESLSGEAARAALDGYLSYGGRWSLDGDLVRHEVEVCLRPDWIGRTLRRRARLEDGVLTLTTDSSQFNAAEGSAVLEWTRGAA